MELKTGLDTYGCFELKKAILLILQCGIPEKWVTKIPIVLTLIFLVMQLFYESKEQPKPLSSFVALVSQ